MDLFAGPGGWSEGLRQVGLSDVGIELDPWACATRAAAGHATIRADVATYPLDHLVGLVWALIASPPCQDFSRAGKRGGVNGRTGHLTSEVMRWAEALRPVWIACEQVPDVLPIWREYVWRLQQLGYSTWAGLLNAADFGVPQTRVRAFLLAHRERPALPPEPTHCRGGREAGLLVPALLPWASMAEALEWGGRVDDGVEMHRRRGAGDRRVRPDLALDEPAFTYAPGGRGTMLRWLHTNRDQRPNGDRQTVAVDRPAPSVTGKSGGQWKFVNRNQPRAARGEQHEPAPTIAFGHNAERVEWVVSRPATTVQGDARFGRPGHKDRDQGEAQFAEESVRVSVEEAAVLQGFRRDYPWRGTKTARFRQVGDAVPPPMAAAVVGALTGRRL